MPRVRKPLSGATKLKIKNTMLRIGHKPPSQKGNARSLETRQKIRLKKIGYRHTDEVRQKMSKHRTGDKNNFFGKVHSQESKEKMSKVRKDFYLNGGKPPNYIFDRSKVAKRQNRSDTAYGDWRKNVKNRDKWKCQLADENCGGKIVAHHIFPWHKYPTLRYEINNGITLCHSHHPRKRGDEEKLIIKFLSIITT